MTAKTTRAELVAEYLKFEPFADLKGVTKVELRFMLYAQKVNAEAKKRGPSRFHVLYP